MSDTAYNRKRTIEEFRTWLGAWLGERMCPDRVLELYRRNREAKRVVEEAWSIWHYFRRYFRRGDMFIELRDGNQNFDAILYDEHDRIVEYIEIVNVPQADDHVIRHELADQGRLSQGTIWANLTASFYEYSKAVASSIASKMGKPYPPNTTLVVVLSGDMVLDEAHLNELLRLLEPPMGPSQFKRIVLLHEDGDCWHTLLGM